MSRCLQVLALALASSTVYSAETQPTRQTADSETLDSEILSAFPSADLLLLESNWSVGLQLGVLGLGAQVEYLLTARSRLRLQYHIGELTWQQMLGSRRYDLDSQIEHVLLSSYWHPFYSGFYITTGLAYGEVKTQNLTPAQPPELAFDFGNLGLELGLGWKTLLNQKWSVDLQVGLLFQQEPDVRFGKSFAFDLTGKDQLLERQSVQQDLRLYEILPHLTLSVSYRL